MSKEKVLKYGLLAGDILLMYVALFLAVALRGGDFFSTLASRETMAAFLYYFSFLHPVWVLFLFTFDFYEITFFKVVSRFIARLTAFTAAAIFLGIAFFYFRPVLAFTPKTILLLDVAIFVGLFSVWRYFFNRFAVRNFKEKIIVIGFPGGMEAISELLLHSSYSLRGIFAPKNLLVSPHQSGGPIIETIDELEKIIKEEHIATAVFTDDLYGNKDLVRQIFSRLPLKIRFLQYTEFYELLTKKVSLSALNEIWFLEKISQADDKIYFLLKRLFDIFLSLLFFSAMAVLLPFVALAIKLDSVGPVFYSQQRVGKGRNIFTLYKFRTMTHGGAKQGQLWRETEKGHVTQVGAFLRRFHIDELPQSLAILKGDLSFVGPRTEWLPIAEIFEKEIPFYHQRYLVDAGFTGWAQINFPPSNSVEQAKDKFEYDLYYIKNRSLFLDLEIILKTVRLILK